MAKSPDEIRRERRLQLRPDVVARLPREEFTALESDLCGRSDSLEKALVDKILDDAKIPVPEGGAA